MSRTQKLDLNKERENRRAYRQTRRAEYEKRMTRRNAQLEAIEKLEAAIDAGNSVADLETAIATAQVHVTPGTLPLILLWLVWMAAGTSTATSDSLSRLSFFVFFCCW